MNMLLVDHECIFCGQKTLVVRHYDTECYAVMCVSCDARGPTGNGPQVAKGKYLKAKLRLEEILDAPKVLN